MSDSVERRSCLPLGKLLILAANKYAVGAAVSLGGLADDVLVSMVEQYVAGAPPRAPVQGERGCPAGSRVGAPLASAKPSGTIAWAEHVEAWVAYNRMHKEQSAERLAERGGFGWYELVELLGHEPHTWEPT